MGASVSQRWWQAPPCPGSLKSTVTLPGSKSQTNRALVLGATSVRPLRVEGALASRDTLLAANALQQLGVTFSSLAPTSLLVVPPAKVRNRGNVDCGLAGTVMRFVPALAAFGEGTVIFDGDEAARRRPLGPLLEALGLLGARVSFGGEPGFLPFGVEGNGGVLPAGFLGRIKLDSSETSQFLSALMLAAPLSCEPFTVDLVGEVPSAAHVEMTVGMLADQGVSVEALRGSSYRFGGKRPLGDPVVIEPDLSNAGPFLAAALICGGVVRVSGWPRQTTQAGDQWRTLLPEFGATVSFTGDSLSVSAPAGHRWRGVDVDLGRVGELAPTVAALCVLADSPSRLRGIAHLRGHETDRLAALATEIRRSGASAEITSDGLIIVPGERKPTRFDSYDDHRMATFGALLGLAIPGCAVLNIETTEKTIPEFPERWEAFLRAEPSPPLPSLGEALSNPAAGAER